MTPASERRRMPKRPRRQPAKRRRNPAAPARKHHRAERTGERKHECRRERVGFAHARPFVAHGDDRRAARGRKPRPAEPGRGQRPRSPARGPRRCARRDRTNRARSRRSGACITTDSGCVPRNGGRAGGYSSIAASSARLVEVRPQHVEEHQFGVGRLPEQEIGQALSRRTCAPADRAAGRSAVSR